jgi:hypothetical protein
MTQLTPRRFKPANSVRNTWFIEPEFGTPVEALLDPAYWAHVSAQLRRGDIIEAIAEDNSYDVTLRVLDAGKLFAKVVVKSRLDIKPAQMLNVAVPDGYEIKFRGPQAKWSVLRGKDVLKDGMDKTQAETWLREHLVAMGVKAA